MKIDPKKAVEVLRAGVYADELDADGDAACKLGALAIEAMETSLANENARATYRSGPEFALPAHAALVAYLAARGETPA